MTVNLNIQANVVDIRKDTPQQSDIFFVDTNVLFWQTYTNASVTAFAYQTKQYPTYLAKALSNGATLTYCGLMLAELAHIIEKTEREIYIKAHSPLSSKEYRHNYPSERANVVAEVQSAWGQVKAIAVSADLIVDDNITDAALNRFRTQALDGYDLLILEAASRVGTGQIKVITDDMDYTLVPDIQVFTSNNNVIHAAIVQGKLLVR